MLRATDAMQDLPVSAGTVTLGAEDLGRVTSVMPFRGRDIDMPEPGTWRMQTGGRLVWSGIGQALVLGAEARFDGAALTDQSDAWVAFRLSGDGAEDVLARLSPVDFRARSFGEGSVARTLVEHMNALVLRDADGFLVLVFRSMALSAKHAIERAMDQVAASG